MYNRKKPRFIHYGYFKYPFGYLKIGFYEDVVYRIDIVEEIDSIGSNYQTKFSKAVAKQFEEYFYGERTEFDIDYEMIGTKFQLKVWEALKTVTYGETISYSDLGAIVGLPQAPRAIGRALGKNPLLILIPCHRIIKKTGRDGDYVRGAAFKKFLLNLEEETLDRMLKENLLAQGKNPQAYLSPPLLTLEEDKIIASKPNPERASIEQNPPPQPSNHED